MNFNFQYDACSHLWLRFGTPKTTMKTKINAHPPAWPCSCTMKPCFSKIASSDFHVDGNTIAGNGLPRVCPRVLRGVLHRIDMLIANSHFPCFRMQIVRRPGSCPAFPFRPSRRWKFELFATGESKNCVSVAVVVAYGPICAPLSRTSQHL